MAVGHAKVEAGLEIFDAAPVGAVVTSGPAHTLVYVNSAARSIFGDLPLGEPPWETPNAPIDLGDYRDQIAEVHESGERVLIGEVPARVHGPDETRGLEQHWFDLSFAPIVPSNAEPGIIVIAIDVTDRIRQARQIKALDEERQRIAARHSTLGRLAKHLVWVTDAAGDIVEPSPGWEAVTGQPFEEFRRDGWAAMVHPSDREAVLRSWRRALAEVPTLWEQTYRLHMIEGGYRHVRVRAVPVKDSEGEVVEWVGTCTDIEHYLETRRRDRLLTRAATAVSGTSRLYEMLTALAQVIVPELADDCRVYAIRDTPSRPPGGLLTVERVATVVREGLPEFASAVQEQRGPRSPIGRAINSRRPAYHRFPPGRPPEDIGPPALRRWLVEAEVNCLVAIPIIIDGEVAAAASVSVRGGRPPIDEDDVALIRVIVERAHDALSTAISFRRTQQFALAIQHSLLTDPPTVPGLEIAARYQSTVLTAGVGGDWYDSFVLPDGSMMLSIGDVAGHDLPAAVTMGKVRDTLRGLAVGGSESPAEVVRHLNWAMENLYAESTATCALVRVIREQEGLPVLRYALAGHPPPLLIDAVGGCRFLEGGRNPLLGVPYRHTFQEAEATLPAGATLLLYTDGLIEHRGELFDVGLARLSGQAGVFATEPVANLCDKLLAALPISGQDDVAMIALRASTDEPSALEPSRQL